MSNSSMPHWVAVDPEREILFVTGEHTGNLAVLETEDELDDEVELEQVIGISLRIPECVPELDEAGIPELEEPHVHGVQVDPERGSVYVSDEGEHCFYEWQWRCILGSAVTKPRGKGVLPIARL